MNILSVIPIVRGISQNTLSYFTKENIPLGSIISIPLRSKTAIGLVIDTSEVRDLKTEIKNLPYNLKKTSNIKSHAFLRDTFIKSAEYLAKYYASSIGAVLFSLIPKPILYSDKTFSLPQKENKDVSFETLLLQADNEERYATYKSIVREEFAKGHSVFFCLPTTEDIKNAKHTLEKGIEAYTYTLHSDLKKEEIVNIWKKILEEEHPVLILATGYFLSIPRGDIGTIIVEKENSRNYKTPNRPFLDIRKVAEVIAKKSNIRLILGDLFLSIETLWKEKNGNYTPLFPLKFRSLTTAECKKIEMLEPAHMEKKEFKIISDDLKKILQKSIEGSEHSFLFCGRKGLYPHTVCSDCGTVVICNNCSAPVVLHKKKINDETKNIFICHHCGKKRDADELCIYCGGWRLLPLGIGTEKVAEEIKKIFKDAYITIMDTEHIHTHNQAVKARDIFYNNPGSILIGTEMALTYLNQKIENTAVISVDSYLSIPDFKINEKVFHILLELRSLSEKQMIIQTRKKNMAMFDYAVLGNLIDFYRDEILERKNIGYPPFVNFIKLTMEGNKNTTKKYMDELEQFFKPYVLSVFESFNPSKNGHSILNGLISLENGKWIDEDLLSRLKSLPPFLSIKVDPDTLL